MRRRIGARGYMSKVGRLSITSSVEAAGSESFPYSLICDIHNSGIALSGERLRPGIRVRRGYL